MKPLFDSFWRAAADCLRPRVMLLSLLPLGVMTVLALGLGWFYWAPVLAAVQSAMVSWGPLAAVLDWAGSLGAGNVSGVLAPLLVVSLSVPLIVVVSLLLVAAFMTPAMVTLIAERRYPTLERKRGGSFIGSVFGSTWATLAALFALLLSIPLWFVPPLVLLVPPLIWGWLTYRVMTYDVLAEHASVDERRELTRRHRSSLFGMGVLTGYLGAAPSLVWASGALFLVFAPVLIPVAVWIYTLVFAFSSLWFAHYALGRLQALRTEGADSPAPNATVVRHSPSTAP